MGNSVVSQVIPTSKGFSTHPYRPDDRTSDISLRTGRLKSPKRPPKDPNPLVHPHRSQTLPPPPPPLKCPVNVSHKSKSRNASHLMISHGAIILPKRVKPRCEYLSFALNPLARRPLNRAVELVGWGSRWEVINLACRAAITIRSSTLRNPLSRLTLSHQSRVKRTQG